MLKCQLTAGQKMQIVVYDGEPTEDSKLLYAELKSALVTTSQIVDIGLRGLALEIYGVYTDADMSRVSKFNGFYTIRIEGTLVKKEPVKYVVDIHNQTLAAIVKPRKKENSNGPT